MYDFLKLGGIPTLAKRYPIKFILIVVLPTAYMVMAIVWPIFYKPAQIIQEIKDSPNSTNVAAETVNLTINKNVELPKPKVSVTTLASNQPVEAGYRSEYAMFVDTAVPINNLRVNALAKGVISMEIASHAGVSLFGAAGITDEYAFDNIQGAYGKQFISVVTKEPRDVLFYVCNDRKCYLVDSVPKQLPL